MFQQTDKSHLMRQQQEVGANEDEYYYDYYVVNDDTVGDNAEYEDFDMIFDKVVIFSHENAAKGR